MISIIMLTHNRRGLAQQMILDILKQSYRDFEYIIVNNGSIDGTDRMLKKYAESDNRIKVITFEEAQSIGRGRNVGLQNARGDFVAFIDDDDRVDEDFLEFLVNLQKEEQADITMCGADELLNGHLGPQCMYNDRFILTGKEAVIALLKREFIRAGTPTKLFRKDILLRFPFDESAKSEDIHTIYKYFANANKVVLHGIPKYHFIRHGENNSMFTSDYSRLTPVFLKEYLDVYRERADYLCGLYPGETDFFRYTVWSFELSMCHKIIENDLYDCEQLFIEMKEEIGKYRDAIINCRYVQDFERDWLGQLYD